MREDMKRRLSEWFASERGETLGNLGSEMLLDFIDEQMSWVWYNQGIQDARIQLSRDVASLSERIELLEKFPPSPARRR
ncbi:MAG: hypothetical protein RL318_248 [Fibrobacterota bacterium]